VKSVVAIRKHLFELRKSCRVTIEVLNSRVLMAVGGDSGTFVLNTIKEFTGGRSHGNCPRYMSVYFGIYCGIQAL
jgi:hypothetical protein